MNRLLHPPCLLLLLCAGQAQAADFQHALIVIVDDVGTDKVGAYAGDVDNPTENRPSTPNLDNLAAAGVRFTDAWAAPTCSPTRALVYTGELAHRNGLGAAVNDNAADPTELALDSTTLPQLALENGFATALFGKAHIGELAETPDSATTAPLDLADYPVLAGFDWFYGNTDGALNYNNWLYQSSVPDASATSGWYTSAVTTTTVSPTNKTTSDAVTWMNNRSAEGSRMLTVVSYNLAHSTGNGSAATWAPAVRSCGGTTSGDQTTDYKFTMECLDTELLELFSSVPDLENTLVVFTGDNGTPKGVAEGNFNDGRGKATLYESGLRVPFVLADGAALQDALDNGGVLPDGGVYRIGAGATATDPATVVDIFATVVDYLDLASTADCVPGDTCGRHSTTLRPVLEGGPAEREFVVTETFQIEDETLTGAMAVRTGDYKFIGRTVGGADSLCRDYELYDLATDRWEETDLYEDSAYAAIVETLRAEFDRVVLEGVAYGQEWGGHADCDSCGEEIWYDGWDSSCDSDSDFDQDFDGVDWPTDCDDTQASVYPGATDTWYDGVDSDCAGNSDFDQDGDGADLGPDCDDTDPTRSPLAAEVWYDGVDQNCDGRNDYDQDGDGFSLEVDCDDTDAASFPGAPEVWYDGVDQACDGGDDYDQDGDTFQLGDDCDDTDPGAYPGAAELPYDGVDSDCAGDSDYDADGDAFDSAAFGGSDCDDGDAGIWPGAPEIAGDGIDSNCDGAAEVLDLDGDGSPTGVDCDDGNPSVYPGAAEVWYDGVDQNCDGANDWDQDADGYTPTAYGGTDCDDTSAAIRPGATEVWYDGVDQNCDGRNDYDRDLDTYTSSTYGGTDCNDNDSRIKPGAREIWYDGVDQNCDGRNDYDRDNDGYTSSSYGGTDCNDTNAAIKPNAVEIWYDGVDQNCDGANDYDRDGDGYTSPSYGGTDCNDSAPRIYPGAPGWNLDCTRAS